MKFLRAKDDGRPSSLRFMPIRVKRGMPACRFDRDLGKRRDADNGVKPACRTPVHKCFSSNYLQRALNFEKLQICITLGMSIAVMGLGSLREPKCLGESCNRAIVHPFCGHGVQRFSDKALQNVESASTLPAFAQIEIPELAFIWP